MRKLRTNQRGATLIHVAIAMVALLALSALSIDFGVKWVSRGQAQNAADAGALAGAVALAFDDQADYSDAGPAKQSALRYATQNAVWGESPKVDVATDVSILCADNTKCAASCYGSQDTCVRVNVYRNQNRPGWDPFGGKPLPTFFAKLVGIGDQGVRATATAKVVPGNASNCLKPWAVPDKWIEHYPVPVQPWSPDSEFNKYYETGSLKGTPLPVPDEYRPPNSSGTGTGFTCCGPDSDYGTPLLIKPGKPTDSIAPGWFFAVDLTSDNRGGNDYRYNISHCSGVTIGIGNEIQMDMNVENGDMIGPTRQGVQDLIALDPYARWVIDTDNPKGHVVGGCMQNLSCAQSPRIVSLPIFDTGNYADGRQTGKVTLKIINILGFFIDEMQGNNVRGYLMSAPGLTVASNSTVTSASAFTYSIILVR